MSSSLLSKYLDPDLERELEARTSPAGWTFPDLIRCGRIFPDCAIGVHAGDAASYEVFAPLLDRIIADVHGCTAQLSELSGARPQIDPSLRDDLAVLSTTVRVTRNLRGSHFPALMGRRTRLEVERRIATALEGVAQQFEGRYLRLRDIELARRRTLEAQNMFFDGDDRYLAAAGITRDWPEGRGLWCSVDRRMVVWVNEEDHLRILARSPDGDLEGCLTRVRELAWALEERLGFHHDPRLGYLSSCPSNVGTGLRASVELRLPRLSRGPEFLRTLVESYGLELRGRRGERSEPIDAIFNIANRRRLGSSEVESVERLAAGVVELLAAERGS